MDDQPQTLSWVLRKGNPIVDRKGTVSVVVGEGAVRHAAVANEKLPLFTEKKIPFRPKDETEVFQTESVLSSEKAVDTVGGGPVKLALLLCDLYLGTWSA